MAEYVKAKTLNGISAKGTSMDWRVIHALLYRYEYTLLCYIQEKRINLLPK